MPIRMEPEEQKPKDILLDVEIKQEIEDFLGNVKEEPYEDDRSELVVPKQETQELLENAKEEPMEDEYSDQIIPKLEEMTEQSTPYVPIPNNPVQKFFIQTRKVFPKSKLCNKKQESLSSTTHLDKRRCSVCSQSQLSKTMKHVTMKEEKLIIMIGCILRNDYTLEEAQLFMKRNGKIFICYAHFFETIDGIYNYLQIREPEGIASCSINLMNSLMVNVRALFPGVMTSHFRNILHEFIVRNTYQKQKRSDSEKYQNKLNFRCLVCFQMQGSNRLKNVTLEDDKLTIMIGCMLRDELSLDQAKEFMFPTVAMMICHSHFHESISQICKTLNVTNPHALDSCSDDSMKNLMITVNSLRPELEFSQFCVILQGMSSRNIPQKRRLPFNESDQNRYVQNRRCSICTQMQIRSCLKQVSLLEEKFVLMVGCILRCDVSVDQAKIFLSKQSCSDVCHDHLVEAINVIYEVLQIENHKDIMQCSFDSLNDLMAALNEVFKCFTVPYFRTALLDFVTRNRKHLGKMI